MPLLFASREEETRLGVVGTALLAGVGVGLLSVVWRGALDGENCIGAVCVPMD
jgi:asparagine N-glycosylation enzyme membrane subunit Stt3